MRQECQEAVEQARAELADLTRSHELRAAEYERQLAFLRARLADEQRELETARADNRSEQTAVCRAYSRPVCRADKLG